MVYRTTSKRNEQIAWIILVIALVGTVPLLPELIVTAVTDDLSQYSTLENVLSVVLGVLAAFGLLYFYYTLIASVLYSRAVCYITGSGIRVCYRLPVNKDRLFTWDSIDKVLLATSASDKPELELRCFTNDFMANGKGFARKYPPESNAWANKLLVINQQKRMVTIQFTPELLDTIKQYHPDIIPYPNEKVVEGYMDYLNENSR